MNDRETGGKVNMQGADLEVDEFKYLGSTIQSNGKCKKESEKKCRQDGSGGDECQGCDRRIAGRVKRKVY